MTDTSISSYCHIVPGKVMLNGQTLVEDGITSLPEFIRVAYKAAGMAYPKFYKMDDLCKLALVAAEHLMKDSTLLERHGKEQLGLIVQNGSSTYDTDSTYQLSIDDRANYFPSPAVFVYTLPNIMLGEICIKHKIFGENALLITPAFNPKALLQHLELLFASNRISACLGGWVEQRGLHYEAFLFLAEKSQAGMNTANSPLTAETLEQLYQTSK